MLQLFDNYFLMLVLIQGFIVGFLDFKVFKEAGNNSLASKAKFIGRTLMILAVVLFVSARLS